MPPHAQMLTVMLSAAVCCGAAPSDEGGGQYVANLVFVNLPKDSVKGLLDPGLELGAVPAGLSVPEDQHPVTFCFGEQRDVGMGWNYNEFIMSIPYAYLTDGMNGPFNFNVRLYLDNATHFSTAREAILAGWAYSIAKRAAHITTTPVHAWGLEDHQYLINDRNDASKRLLTLNARTTTGWEAASSFPNLASSGAILQQLNIGDTSITGKDHTGKFHCFNFYWQIDSARVASIEGEMSIDSAYLPGLPTGQHNFTGIAKSTFGGFRLATNWTMSGPNKECV